MRASAAVAVLLVSLAACGQPSSGSDSGADAASDSTSASASTDSTDSHPVFTEYVATGPAPVFPDGSPDIRITLAADTVSVQAQCNAISGPATWGPGTVSVGAASMTEIGCAPDLAKQDEWLVAALGAVSAWTVRGADVRLSGAEGSLDLVPADDVDPEPPSGDTLLGTSWRLVAVERSDLLGRDGSVSNEPASGPPLRISDDGRLRVDLTCATLRAPVTITDEVVRIGHVVRVDHSCPMGLGLHDQVVTKVLHGAVRWERTGDRLQLTSGPIDASTSLVFRTVTDG